MTLILLLCVILPLMTTAMECPNAVQVNMTCYNVSYVLDLKGEFRRHIVIKQMGILQNKRILYYSFEPKLEDPEYNKVGFIDLEDPSKFGEITPVADDVKNFGFFDFDQVNNIMYLGGSVGIYKLNILKNSITYFSARGDTILSLFFKDKVYLVREGEHEIVFQEGDVFEPLLKDDKKRAREEYLPKLTVKKFVITNDNTVVFLSTQGLFAAEPKMNSKVHRLSKNAFFGGLILDLIGDVYAWWVDGIYKVILNKNLDNSTVVKIANVSDIGSLTFDNDNSILYTVDKKLFRLFDPNEKPC